MTETQGFTIFNDFTLLVPQETQHEETQAETNLGDVSMIGETAPNLATIPQKRQRTSSRTEIIAFHPFLAEDAHT